MGCVVAKHQHQDGFCLIFASLGSYSVGKCWKAGLLVQKDKTRGASIEHKKIKKSASHHDGMVFNASYPA